MSCPSCGGAVGESSKFCPSCGAVVVRAAEPETVSGKIIAGKFRVERMIGEGGMGKVYLARQMSLDKPVVLKVLRPTLLSDERTVKRFQREALAASRLNHPNSISVLDFGQDPDTQAMFIAMEFVAGKDLHQILTKEWPLPEARIVRIVSQVLSALSDAHGAGVVHRDLKPENIMVEQRRGEPDFVKVLDFGIAKIQDSTGEEGPALTRAGFVCGTPEYMSPEQARGGTVDARSDLYAVGVILYQLATQLLPFESDSAVGFATKHLTEEPPPPSRRRPDAKVSPGMERLILKALSKDPTHRPQTAEAFRAELLNVDKERRAGAGQRARPKQPGNGNVLAPLPRKATAPEEIHTQVTGEPKFGRAAPSDSRPIPSGQPAAALSKADTAEMSQSPGAGTAVFKVITVLLVLTAAGLGYVYFRDSYRPVPAQVSYENAPVPVDHAVDALPAFDRQVPLDQRDATAATRLVSEGDAAHFQGRLSEALERYEAAFKKNPTPDLSLKLGELYHVESKTEQARGWWRRHLQDHPESKARHYIRKHYGDL